MDTRSCQHWDPAFTCSQKLSSLCCYSLYCLALKQKRCRNILLGSCTEMDPWKLSTNANMAFRKPLAMSVSWHFFVMLQPGGITTSCSMSTVVQMVQAMKLALLLGKQSALARCKAGWSKLLECPTACTLSRHPCLPPYVPPIPLHLHEYAAASDEKERCVSL